GYVIRLEPPTTEQLFRLETDAELFERLRRETAQTDGQRLPFPEEPAGPQGPAYERNWPPLERAVEPNYVCHGRLFFEQPSGERYGWDLGIVQPVLATGVFYLDTLLWPAKVAIAPLRCHECSSGKCLPGDPVPLQLACREGEPWHLGCREGEPWQFGRR